MKCYQVIRTHTSPYQAINFLSREEKLISSRDHLKYSLLPEADLKAPTILITNTHTQLTQLPPELLRNTELIVHPNSGYDHFATEHHLWSEIPLVVGHEIRAQAVAEYSLSCLFQGRVELPQHLSWDKSRNWERPLLKDQEVWVFGYGHIGKIVCQTLASLGMKIIVIDPFVSSPFTTLKSWEEGELSGASVVIACCSLNQSSRNMFNEKFFSQAPPELLFINGARGKLVEEKALKDFLRTHKQAFAFLDVFPEEPFSDEWRNVPQVWKTSHIAGVHRELDQGILDFEIDVIDSFLQMGPVEFRKKYQQELLQNKWKEGVLI